MIEVEVKLPLSDADELKRRLSELGATFITAEDERDVYFNAPHRDFANTDEALRIRFSKDTTLTYKGPKLDKVSKTRKEIVVPIADADQAIDVLKALGFKEVATVVKRRQKYQLDDINISIDDVRELGTYVEIETMTSCEEYQPALNRIFETLYKLGLSKEDMIRESYLELILRR